MSKKLDMNILVDKYAKGKTYKEIAEEMNCEVKDVERNVSKFHRRKRFINHNAQIVNPELESTFKGIKEFIEKRLLINDMSVDSRDEHLKDARSLFFKICRVYTKGTWHDMGTFMGKRNHATAIHGCNNTFPNAYKHNSHIRKAYDYFESTYKYRFISDEKEADWGLSEIIEQRDSWKEKYEKIFDELMDEKNRERVTVFDHLIEQLNDEQVDELYTRMEATVKMLTSIRVA